MSLPGIATRWALAQAAALLMLAVGAAWLMQRAEIREQERAMISRGRALSELVVHAAGPQASLADTPRLLRVLECATRDGSLEAAAILDSNGTIIAHTDVARDGMRLGPLVSYATRGGELTADLSRRLFGRTAGPVLLQYIATPQGRQGVVVVQLPDPAAIDPVVRAYRYFLPAGLLLVAFIAISQATVRRAVKPTSEFLDRLTHALAALPPAAGPRDKAMAETVVQVEALTHDRDELLVTSRLVDFERRRMEAILDGFPDGIVVTNASQDVVFANRRATRILDLPPQRGQILRLEEAPAFLELVRESERTGQVLLPPAEADGDQRILFSRISLAAAGGELTETLYTLRDVTAQMAAQRTQVEFLTQISHELKAPLHTIVTFVEELAENPNLTAAERRDYCNVLDLETRRMAQLIGNLLQLSRIQLGGLSTKVSFLKPGPLVTEQVESLRRQAEGRGLTLRVDVPENLPAVNADKDLLGVAINNLVSNALKYTPAGGRVTVTAAAVDGGVAIKVEDTGFGIPAEMQEKIFERFFRVDDPQVREQGGSGLGLAVVKEIVDAHGGDITVDSAPAAGSRFRIWLPAREVPAPSECLT